MTWHAVRVWIAAPDPRRDTVLRLLFADGSLGVHDNGDSIVTHFPGDHNVGALCVTIGDAVPGARIDTYETPDVDWSEQWKHAIGAHRIGRLAVAPPWLAGDLPSATTIVIEPAMAFGTGEHATTRGVLRLMQDIVRPGDVVADLGAGSAVLSIAAAKLGAARVVAVEMDGDAIGNAEGNVARNGETSRVHVLHGDATVLLPLLAPVRVVLANIISSVLVELLPTIAAALTADGAVVLSGILREERATLLALLADTGWRVNGEDAEGEWWSVAVARTA